MYIFKMTHKRIQYSIMADTFAAKIPHALFCRQKYPVHIFAAKIFHAHSS